MTFPLKPFVVLFLFPALLSGQDTISSFSPQASGTGSLYISGYMRGSVYSGTSDKKSGWVLQSGIGEMAIRAKAEKEALGFGYVEARLRGGSEYGSDTLQTDLREAYVAWTPGSFDFRLGKQIILWGRADGFNPTNNLTPENYFVRSPQPDDMHLGNFLFSGKYSWRGLLQLETVFVPEYKPSIYRLDLFDQPGYVSFSPGRYPDHGCMAGIRLSTYVKGFDGSLSYFKGYDQLPGIDLDTYGMDGGNHFYLKMQPVAFEQQTLGLDFSTVIFGYGLRGEAAWRRTPADHADLPYVPNPDLQWVIGLDKMKGNFSILLQYMGTYVFDFTNQDSPPFELPSVGPPEFDISVIPPELMNTVLAYELEKFNRIIHNQIYPNHHSLSARPAYTWNYNLWQAELFALYNFTTQEYLIMPMLSHHLSDNLKITWGGQYYTGPVDTNFDFIGPVLNGGFLELRFMF